MKPYSHAASVVLNQPWAVVPSTLHTIAEILAARIRGEHLVSAVERQAMAEANSVRRSQASIASIAVVPLFGVLAQRVSPMEEQSGASSTERTAAMFRRAVADPDVTSIVLNVDSPGGQVFGTLELAEEIYRARSKKPIVAIANSLAASAAYWIASAAGELVVTPGGEVGSIGVYGIHYDESRAFEMAGVKPTMVSAGKYKVEGNPYEALGDEAHGALQRRVDDYYALFVNAVAKHRGVSADQVRRGYAEGRSVGAKEAVKLGMVDRIGTLQETVDRIQRAGSRLKLPHAADSRPQLSAEDAADMEMRRLRLRLHQVTMPPDPGLADLARRRQRLEQAAQGSR